MTTEVRIQLGLFVILLLLRAFDKASPHIHLWEVLLNANHLIVALIVNYYFLPRYFYTKRYGSFFCGVAATIVVAILIKELLLGNLFEENGVAAFFWEMVHQFVQFLTTMLLYVGVKLGWDAHQKQGELEKLKNVVTESELQFLKSQINPHFLFNNLNNLYAHALERSGKTPRIILELSSLLRYMLYECRAQWVPLEKEFKYLVDFIHLQELQVEDKGNIRFSMEGSPSGKFIAPLILVVFVENCFKHSISSQTEKININIDLVIRGDQLSMYCANSYSETSNIDQLSRGIGLENVKTRLDLLYPDAYSLEIRAEDNLYEVELSINLSNTVKS